VGRREHGSGPLLARPGRRYERAKDRDRADPHGEVGEPGCGESVHEHAHDLRVRGGAVDAQQFHAELRELARLAAQRCMLAEDVAGVAQPVRTGHVDQAGGREPRDRQRHLGPECQQRPVEVHEAERGALQRGPGAGLECRVLLDRRCLHVAEAVAGEHVAYIGRDAAALGSLVEQDVAEAAWRHGSHLGHVLPSSCPTIGTLLHFSTVE